MRGLLRGRIVECGYPMALFCATLLGSASLSSPASPSIALTGAVPKPARLAQKDLEALGPVKESWTEHGTTHQVYGVAVESRPVSVPASNALRAPG